MRGKRGNRIAAFVIALAASAMLAGWSGRAAAQHKFPVKPVRLIVGNTPGSSSDTLSRLIGPKLSELWGQPVVIENRPGAGGLLAATVVAKATADGYTLQLVSPSFAIRAALFTDLPYDSIRDFSTLGEIGFTHSVIVAAPSLGVKSVKDFMAWANANPGKIFFASAWLPASRRSTWASRASRSFNSRLSRGASTSAAPA